MPLISLCVKGAANDDEALSWGRKPANKKTRTSSLPEEKPQAGYGSDDFHMRTIVHRRLGDEVDPTIMNIINDPNRDVIVLFPSDDAVTLEEGMKEIERRRIERGKKAEQGNECTSTGNSDECNADEKIQQKIVVMFLDATWKYALEMEKANTKGKYWPKNIIRVKLSPPKTQGQGIDGGKDGDQEDADRSISKSGPGDRTVSSDFPIDFKPERFNIRTPPSSGHLSTAECLAWVCAKIEDDPSIYEILMRPLDFMVEKWKSFSPDGRGRGKSNFLDGDGDFGGGGNQVNDKRDGKMSGRGGGKSKKKR